LDDNLAFSTTREGTVVETVGAGVTEPAVEVDTGARASSPRATPTSKNTLANIDLIILL